MHQMTMQTEHSTDDISKQAEASLRQNGRSFHWAKRFLGQETGSRAARLYAFCRLLDDMADGDIPDGPARLTHIKAMLAGDPKAHDPDLSAFLPFMQQVKLPRQPLNHLIDGLLLDQQDVAIADEAELIRYGYYVAGTVGLLMCPVLHCHDRQAFAHALDLGIAMQLTNIARDVLEDAKMGRRYVPAEWVQNMTPEQICAAAEAPDSPEAKHIASAINRILDRAEDYYQSGFLGLAALPLRARLAIAVAGTVYRQIGRQLRRAGTNWHAGRTVTSRWTKLQMTLQALPLVLRTKLPDWHDARLHAPLYPDMRP